MSLITLGVLTVITLLSRPTHAEIPPPSNVAVNCDNGPVVEWKATGLSERAEFELLIKTNTGRNITVYTKSHRFNISSLLDDPGYNMYVVKVKATDGKQESEFAESPTFSFNDLMPANIICNLKFPEVTVFPKGGQLFAEFINPLHLYRDSPALRGLLTSENLEYFISYDEIFEHFTCTQESKMCLSNMSFSEKKEKYCVTLGGFIRQTRVQETELYCHTGELYPATPLSTYLIPLLVSCVVFIILALISALLVKRAKNNIKKEIYSMFPGFLTSDTTLIEFLSVPPDPASPNVNLTLDIQEKTKLEETTHSSQYPEEDEDKDEGEDDELTNSGSGPNLDSLGNYGKSEDLSGSNLSSGYDRPHTLAVEMSPGDMVQNYKC